MKTDNNLSEDSIGSEVVDPKLWSSPKAQRPKATKRTIVGKTSTPDRTVNNYVLNRVLYNKGKDDNLTFTSSVKPPTETLTRTSSATIFSFDEGEDREEFVLEESFRSHWNKVAESMNKTQKKFELDDRFPKIDYVKGKYIGRGSFSTVYSALDIGSNSCLALKIIPFYNNEKLLNKIKKEFLTISCINHDNIIQYKGLQFINDQRNLVVSLEYIQSTVRNSIKMNGPLREKQAMKLISDAVRGIVHLHKHNIIHRDIKCSNLLLTSDGKVKITDFDTFLLKEDFKLSELKLRGSIPWLAPEIYQFYKGLSTKSHSVTELFELFVKGDIWSIGCSFREMVSGKRPWSSIPSLEQVGKHLFSLKAKEDFNFVTLKAESLYNSCCCVEVNLRPTSIELLGNMFT